MSDLRVELSDRTTKNTVFVEVFTKRDGDWTRIHVSEEELAEPTELELDLGGIEPTAE